MLSLTIAARFLRKSLTQSIVIAAGIAIGIGVQVFLGSLIISLQENLVDQTIGSRSQVTVQPATRGGSLDYTEAVKTAIAGESGITTQVPVREFSALLRIGKESTPLQFTGGELAQLDTIYGLSDKTIAGTAGLTGSDALIGTDLADKYELAPGDAMTLVLPDGKTVEAKVRAVVDLGSAAANSSLAFSSSSLAQGVLDQTADQYSAVQTQLANVFDSSAVAKSLGGEPALAGLKVTDWQAENQDLLDALSAQSSSSYTIQFFVLVAVALGIASTLAISAVQKTRQIGILKAMGMSDRQSGRIFLWQAAILGVVGAAAGVAVGVGLVTVFSSLSSSFPITPQLGFTAISFAVGVLVALLSSLIPSRRTSKLDPIEVIQGG
ncbi:MAG TPA: FtsX-like permease family protein [Thermoleophilia bacterium]|nr:FtsX-like permease family protein [Thermoleophilia bacterium]